MKHAFLSGSFAGAAAVVLALTGCFGDSSGADSGAAGLTQDLRAAEKELFALPSALQSASPSVERALFDAGALAKSSAELASRDAFAEALEPYRLVPAYIHIAESAKNQVMDLVSQMAAEDWPDAWEGTTDEGYLVRTIGKDTALSDEHALFFRSLRMSKDGAPVLNVSFFRNGRNQYSGTFLWQSEGADSTRVLVHFNGRNAAVAGERMLVKVVRPLSALEDANAPSIVRIAALRRNDHLAVSGISYHPTWQDADAGQGFWSDGPKFLGVRAVADPQRDVALIRVALADSLVPAAQLFRNYLLHDVTAQQAAVHMRSLMASNDTINRLVWWSLERGKSLQAPESYPLDLLDFLSFATQRVPADLSVENAYQVLQNSRESILAGDDASLKTLYWSVTLRQPIALRSQAVIVGAGLIPADFELTESTLDSGELELPEPASALDETEMLLE